MLICILLANSQENQTISMTPRPDSSSVHRCCSMSTVQELRMLIFLHWQHEHSTSRTNVNIAPVHHSATIIKLDTKIILIHRDKNCFVVFFLECYGFWHLPCYHIIIIIIIRYWRPVITAICGHCAHQFLVWSGLKLLIHATIICVMGDVMCIVLQFWQRQR